MDLLDIPDKYKAIRRIGNNGEVREEPFLIFDNYQGGDEGRIDRILAFSSPDCMRILSQASIWFMDGNFAMAPTIFRQVYVVRVPFHGSYLTCLYAFLPGKTREAYSTLFTGIFGKMTEMGLEVAVNETVTDFEMAVVGAIRATFPHDVHIRGCFYHLTQSLWRKIRTLGLETYYHENDEFRVLSRMIVSLAFLPMDRVEEGMDYLIEIWPDDIPNGKQLLEYFEDTYVRQSVRARSSDSTLLLRFQRTSRVQFPPSLWNVHNATMNNSPRTNNICEGWNNRFRTQVRGYHPPMDYLMEWFQKEEAAVHAEILRDQVGNRPKATVC